MIPLTCGKKERCYSAGERSSLTSLTFPLRREVVARHQLDCERCQGGEMTHQLGNGEERRGDDDDDVGHPLAIPFRGGEAFSGQGVDARRGKTALLVVLGEAGLVGDVLKNTSPGDPMRQAQLRPGLGRELSHGDPRVRSFKVQTVHDVRHELLHELVVGGSHVGGAVQHEEDVHRGPGAGASDVDDGQKHHRPGQKPHASGRWPPNRIEQLERDT
uniref:Uncharacterized protein n=1 Tax=Steinernema glaseri TaxID=37863 RepID=A0A1I7ZDH0_9BILA